MDGNFGELAGELLCHMSATTPISGIMLLKRVQFDGHTERSVVAALEFLAERNLVMQRCAYAAVHSTLATVVPILYREFWLAPKGQEAKYSIVRSRFRVCYSYAPVRTYRLRDPR